MIVWTKCIKGGWVKTGSYDHEQMRAQGYVAQKGRCSDFQLVDAWTSEPICWSKESVKT